MASSKAHQRIKTSWSQILPEILDKIIDYLSPIDSFKIRWVCRSWRSIATKKPYAQPFTFEPPHLTLLRPTPTGDRELGFFSLSRRRFINLDLPAPFRTLRCCGCLDGWLIMVSDLAFELTLLHPISFAQVKLPTQPQSFIGSKFQYPPLCRIKKATLSATPTSRNCLVAAMAGHNIILVCRPGGQEWSVFDGKNGRPFVDILFIQGRLCALDSEARFVVISLDSRLRGRISLEVLRSPEMIVPNVSGHASWSLVESCGELLIVAKGYCSPTMKFLVFKLEKSKWVRVRSLGDRSLFVGVVRSESISAGDFVGFRANCIYFTSKLGEMVAPDGVGVFSIADEKVEPITLDVACSLEFEPVWLKPILY